MKKRLCAAIILMMLGLAMTGCGGDADTPTTLPSGDENRVTENAGAAVDPEKESQEGIAPETTLADEEPTASTQDGQTEGTVSQEQETTSEPSQEETQYSEPHTPVTLPDDVFVEPEPEDPTVSEDPTQSVEEPAENTTQQSEPATQPTEDTEPSTQESTEFWGDHFGEGIELPMDVWE